MAVGMLVMITGCAAAPSALTLLPVTGRSGTFEVHEYAIIEQSQDNPTQASFQKRVQAAVSARQSGWHFPTPEDVVQAPNEALAEFGYHLEANPTPPFSGYALYHNQTLVQRDIAQFWPVSVKESEAGSDFLLAYATLDGDHRVASLNGIRPWPMDGQATGQADQYTPPVYYGDKIAYAETAGSEVSVYAGSGILYTGEAPSAQSGSAKPGSLVTWGNHWALELNGHVILDGKDLNQARSYDEVFQWQVIAGRPFYFYTHNGITHMNFAGRDLGYNYDQVLHNGQAADNPGSNGHIIWFYALRDGVWYYVEAGLF